MLKKVALLISLFHFLLITQVNSFKETHIATFFQHDFAPVIVNCFSVVVVGEVSRWLLSKGAIVMLPKMIPH